ncbi:MAG: Spore coat protein CotH, partial [Verrucomicrobiales bacterium]|nr:Spore coat protein CotH [Verrucomicrobiales bacterium]
EVVAKNYLFLDGTTADFSSNLPLLVISTEGKSIGPLQTTQGSTRTNGTLTIIDGMNERSSLHARPDVQVMAGFEYFGNSSINFAKKAIRFETHDGLGNNLEVSILGLPPESDFKLKNPYDDKTMLNDYLAEEMFEELGHYSVRRRFVEAFVDTGGGRINYAGDYYGILVLLETIKIGKNRVDVPSVPLTATTDPAISGGYIFKRDVTEDLSFSTAGGSGFPGQILFMHDPRPTDLRAVPGTTILTPAGSNQVNYLRAYLNRMEQSLYADNWLTATGTNHYSYYLDVDSFVDWFWSVEFPKQGDGYLVSTYFYKDRGGKVVAGPAWDFNLAFGNGSGGQKSGWRYPGTNPWITRLIDGNPDFMQKIADRWSALRTNVLDANRVLNRIDQLAAYLDEAARRDLAKYGTLGVQVYQNPDGPDVDFVHPLSYNDYTANSIIGQMKKYVLGRYLWIDGQFTPPASINALDGMVTNGFLLTMSSKAGAQIYYTTDGTDPRGPGGVTNGILYTGPIAASGNIGIVARCRETNAWKNTWSGPARVTLYTAIPPLRITEIMYHPSAPPPGTTNSASDFEYVEVRNIGGPPLNVNQFSIRGGIDFRFPNIVLPGGQSAVIVKNLDAFQSRYGTNNPNVLILGVFTGQLNDAGDHLVLRGGVGEPILDFSYEANWFPTTDGVGFSLVKTGDNSPSTDWGLASGWRPSAWVGGSPGQDELFLPAPQGVLINEVLAHSQPPGDAIELYNATINPIDVGGWFLSDDFATPRKYVLPLGTIIPALGYLVLYETNTFNFPTNGPTSFALGAKGDDIWLFSGDGTNLTGYADGFTFGASAVGRTFGRYMTSDGTEHFVLQSSNSLGGLNSGPSVGPIVISEINADPVDHHSYPGDEYIELQNIADGIVPLYDPAYPTNTWRLQDAVSYSFPGTNVIVPPGGILLLVSFDPEADPAATTAFRQRNAVPPNVPLFGPWTGSLDNTGDNVLLMRPDEPDPNGSVAYFVVDRVKYSNKPPWPNLWNGTQLSLQRRSALSYGNDPANWVSTGQTAGVPTQPSATPPAITSQPGDLTAPTGRPLLLSINATGPNLRFQWMRNGLIIPGATDSMLTITNFQPQHIGTYNIIVHNSAGSVEGRDFNVSFRLGLQILQQPVSRVATIGGATNFSVSAVGLGPLAYQWKLNGINVNVSNAIGVRNPVLTITNIQVLNQGAYTVSVNDDYDTFTSNPASLALVYRPLFVTHPLSQKVVQGGSVTLSAAATGTTPMTFRWRKQTNTFAYTT